MNYTISYVLSEKFKGREYSLWDNDYSTLIIHDNLPEPTMEEIIQADIELFEENKIKDQRDNILREFPDLLDLILPLWELVVENNPYASNGIQELRVKVKEKYKKFKEGK